MIVVLAGLRRCFKIEGDEYTLKGRGVRWLIDVDYHRPGDKKQLMFQDVTAKLVRSDILRKVPKNILFCIKHT